MTTPRSAQIDLSATSFYHCIARCVRRTYLCGYRSDINKDFSHRKQWIINRIKHLTKAFYIDVCAYAVMSNHYHLVLHVNQMDAKLATFEELLARWALVYANDAKKIQKQLNVLGENHEEFKNEITEKLRHKLSNISRFMGSLNEVIAKMGNLEENITGRFWEGRFKSQALLDEAALLCAMAYVDLNPIRAGLALTPELSAFTSIQERILQLKNKTKINSCKQPKWLMPFIEKASPATTQEAIQFKLQDYLTLVDTTGRLVKDGKAAMPQNLSPILERLQLSQSGWFKMIGSLEKRFSYAVGSPLALSYFMPSARNRKASLLDFVGQCYNGAAA